ncbi:MAG: tetratricopeptide repeat protein [Bacteroidales bacterium]
MRWICLSFTMLALVTYAQKTSQVGSFDEEYDLALELYEKGVYGSAFDKFEILNNKGQWRDYHIDRAKDVEFYLAASKFKQNPAVGAAGLMEFVEKNPNSLKANSAKFILGEYYLDNEQYSNALNYLKSVDPSLLDKGDIDKYQYKLAYSHFNNEQYDEAGTIFSRLKDKKTIYQNPSAYYWGYVNYYNGKYETALQEFQKLENEKGFDKAIPYYITQIYFKQEKYDMTIDKAKSLLASADDLQKQELQKILGVSYFKTGNYDEALRYLNSFERSGGLMGDGENYAKAYCLYHQGNYAAAIPYFEKASNTDSEISQNAYYHLASSYLKQNKKEEALMAFGEASKMNYNSAIREEALFNVAKLSWDTGYSPFDENIKAIQTYLQDYPSGVHKDEAYEYLTQAFLSANDYDKALDAIGKMSTKSPEVIKIAQQIYYNKGVNLFNDHQYVGAIGSFNNAIQQGTSDTQYRLLSRYWKAEAYYKLGDFKTANQSLQQFYRTEGAKVSDVYTPSQYTQGYLSYNLGNYSDALNAFLRYINAKDPEPTKVSDAYNRVGDSYYQQEFYDDALVYYQESLKAGKHEPDYASYMIAMCYGRKNDQKTKQSSLTNFMNKYPNSTYVDDAVYELGLSFEKDNNLTAAKAYYNIILSKYKDSEYYRKVLLKMGLYYFRERDYELAADYYKQVVNEYPNSDEAKEAMEGLKRAYMFNGTVDKFVVFSESVYGTRVSASEQDSMTFRSAERLFLDQSEGAMSAMDNYLSQYSEGAFVLDANYYMGELLYAKKDYTEALKYYKTVASFSANEYTESSLMKCAELNHSFGNYTEAEKYYDQVLWSPSSKWLKLTAQIGFMYNSFNLKKYDVSINTGREALKSEILNQKQKEEIEANIGMCYYEKGEYPSATKFFGTLAERPKTEVGARAKYLLADIKVKQNDKAGAEKDLLELIGSGTSHKYWLGKAFLLLSDIYTQKGETFQAKHTLQSLVNNYTILDDGIVESANKKLKEIETALDTVSNKQGTMEINVGE